MRIGIFGDSYAGETALKDSWWQRLQTDHGHVTTSFGVAGSSILYSAHLIEQHHADFDFNIWCLTCPGRFSVQVSDTPETFWHSTRTMTAEGDPDHHLVGRNNTVDQKNLVDICHKYLKYIFDIKSENLIGKSLIHYFLDKIPNLMIIPCFYVPLEMPFNLFKLSELELQTHFAGQETHDIYLSFSDIRPCHLTNRNNEILAGLIAKNLKSGILQLQYGQFCFDKVPLESMLCPRPQTQ